MKLREAGWPITDTVAPALDEFLRTLPQIPHVLGLGEPTHGEETFLQVRNQMFKHLVEHYGFRVFTFESDCVAGLKIDAYVRDGIGSLDDVMRTGFTHGFGDSRANRDLVTWMRAHNEDRPVEERLRFFGCDAPTEITHAESPREALTALNLYLGEPFEVDELLGDDERWTNPDAAMDPTKSVGSSEDVVKLRLIADDLNSLLVANTPRLIAESRDDWWRARMYGRTAAGLLRYHTAMAWNSPARIPLLLSIRDAMMSENLKSIAELGRTLVFAHNQHLRRERSGMDFAGVFQQWWSAGAIISAQLGDMYAFLATAIGSMPRHGIEEPPADTLEGVLYGLPGDHIVKSADIDRTGLVKRTSDYRYFPLEPDLVDDQHGILFIKRIPPLSGQASAAGRQR